MSLKFNPPPNWPAPPAGWVPPSGWVPDPSWGPAPDGWQFWTDESGAPMPVGFDSVGGYGHMPLAGKKKKKWPWVVGVVAFVFIVASCSNSGKDATAEPAGAKAPAVASAIPKATPSPSAEPPEEEVSTPEPEPVEEEPIEESDPASAGPKAQQQFIAEIAKGAEAYDEASTELKQSRAMAARDKKLCSITGGSFTKWEGEISEIGANNDGDAHITVRFDQDVEIGTWNNAFSDIGDDTLIPSGSRLWETLSNMEEGATVLVSGKFLRGDSACVSDNNLTSIFGSSSPDFKARFSAVAEK